MPFSFQETAITKANRIGREDSFLTVPILSFWDGFEIFVGSWKLGLGGKGREGLEICSWAAAVHDGYFMDLIKVLSTMIRGIRI